MRPCALTDLWPHLQPIIAPLHAAAEWRCQTLDRDRAVTDRRLPLRRRALRAERARAGGRLLPLQALPATHRDGILGTGSRRWTHVAPTPWRGARAGLAPSRRRL